MTIAEHYNVKVYEIMPHMAEDIAVDPAITTANDIYEIVFRRSVYLGGMACVILEIVEQESKASNVALG